MTDVLNRELSWLAFNMRVLEEAENSAHPLFERIRFLSISASNLDEFYMVRVAGLKALVRAGMDVRGDDGLSPKEQLIEIGERANELIEKQQELWCSLQVELKSNDISIVKPNALTKKQKTWLSCYFEDSIFPVLTPLAIDHAHPFPFIPNKGFVLMMELEKEGEEDLLLALIPIPDFLPRFVKVDGSKSHVQIEQVILYHMETIFPKFKAIRSHGMVRILRDSDMAVDDSAEDLYGSFESALQKRRRGQVIHMSVHEDISEFLLHFLHYEFNVHDHDVSVIDGLLGLSDIAQLVDSERGGLLFPKFTARFPERIMDYNGDCFEAIRAKDIIIHHPYETFDVVVKFLEQAAQDPKVVAIKQTLYRTSHDSPVVKALMAAAQAGKSVTAMVELKARFDEEANMRWARHMERAGVHVVFGFKDLKTHAKLSLVVRQEEAGLRSYVHYGTGNYHPINAQIYTDLSYFTCDPALCEDAGQLFNYMTGYAVPENLQKVAISPINLRDTIVALIDKEIVHVKSGRKGEIWIKCNSLLDPAMIDKLYAASQAGVAIQLIVRGICTLRPRVKGLSENIRVKSIVGRYLEHSRIYAFGNGDALPSEKAKVYMSSADLMPRNLDRRIETFVPIETPTVRQQVLEQIMLANLKDEAQSWIMDSDGNYKRMKQTGGFCAHAYFMENPSLSGRGSAVENAPMPPRLKLK